MHSPTLVVIQAKKTAYVTKLQPLETDQLRDWNPTESENQNFDVVRWIPPRENKSGKARLFGESCKRKFQKFTIGGNLAQT